ncbi:von Willebrand factor type A domain protein [Novipirellula aureliae]|uniref:von Willebrand factor type A domain protein n=1 Tax=Novipirellula aureliae TaxID=2527966 RepID=A0A5C6E597_9BACT|nr:VWA domain-containing protein [Novipirellula aureliae]TWU44030.1 von Willebrand factor type A domain protein [Novipirellula aureliae]
MSHRNNRVWKGVEGQPHGSVNRCGSTMVLIAVLLPVLFGLAAFAINIAYMESLNTDVQVTIDAAARAAGREYVLTGSEAKALLAAQEAATENPVAGQVLTLKASDLQFGKSTRSSVDQPYAFTPAEKGNAVRITSESLADGTGNTIPALFPIFGNTFNVRVRQSATSTQSTFDIALVIDRSGSMAFAADEVSDPDVPPATAPVGWDFGDPVPTNARWLDLIAAVKTFNQMLEDSPQDELLALATYSTYANVDLELTDDYNQITDILSQASINGVQGGTNIGDGIYAGRWAATKSDNCRSYASKVIVLMTDGNHNYGSNPYWAAKMAAKSGVTVFTITFSDEANQSAMQTVAENAAGKHFHASDALQLKEAFRDIARNLPSLITE